MTTTMEDIMMDDYYQSLHNDYVIALEDFASSRNIEEFKNNLKKLDKTVQEREDVGNEHIKRLLEEIKSLNLIYDEIINSESKGRNRFIFGTILTIFGLILTALGVYLTIGTL